MVFFPAENKFPPVIRSELLFAPDWSKWRYFHPLAEWGKKPMEWVKVEIRLLCGWKKVICEKEVWNGSQGIYKILPPELFPIKGNFVELFPATLRLGELEAKGDGPLDWGLLVEEVIEVGQTCFLFKEIDKSSDVSRFNHSDY